MHPVLSWYPLPCLLDLDSVFDQQLAHFLVQRKLRLFCKLLVAPLLVRPISMRSVIRPII